MIKRTIEIRTHDLPLGEVPADIREMLAPEEVEAYSKGASYFIELAGKNRDLAKALKKLEADAPVRLYLYSEDEKPYRAYFGFTIMPEGVHPKIRVPSAADISAFPNCVQDLYRAVGGLMEPWADYAGLLPPEDFHSFEDYWIEETNGIDPSTSRCFCYDGGGDVIGFDASGTGVQYEHEEGRLERIDLARFCRGYFSLAMKRA
jgi:hypothetical protein